jgi:hypothetical protein
MTSAPFWETKSLSEMSDDEWERLCDGCGKCCVYRLEDEHQPGVYLQTNVACRLLDVRKARCKAYAERHRWVPDCIRITAENVAGFDWLPGSCAYRRLSEGKRLPDWHPLITGDPGSMRKSGNSIAGLVISEDDAGPLEQHIVIWTDF